MDTAEHILKILLQSGSATTLVFPQQTGWQYSDGKPRNGRRRMQWGYEKNHDFRQISPYISELMQDRAKVTMDGE